jgi:hypothetical protein
MTITGKPETATTTYTPTTPLEAAVLESERFQFSTDTAGREVICVGQRRLPQVVLPRSSDGLHDLVDLLSAGGGRAFTASRGDPWLIESVDPDPEPSTVAAEEYLVMGLRPMRSDGRPVRVAGRRGVVRLFLLPWTMPAKTLDFGRHRHFVVTSSRGVVGDWTPANDGRRGMIVGVPEIWVGILERQWHPSTTLAFRCDVPVPWVADDGLTNAVPATVGAFAASGDGRDPDGAPIPGFLQGETWVAKLPIVMTEGDVVSPVLVPSDITVDEVPDGPWELEFKSPSGFSFDSLR